ncbi:MAG: zinc-binding dehydrogenase [bacterium]
MKSKYVEFTGKNQVEVKEEEISTDNLGPWEVVVENEASLVSAGTELSRLLGMEIGGPGFPARPGYASIGRIKMKGDAVNDYEVGDRVFYAGKHCSVQRFEHGQNHMWGRLYQVPEGISSVDATYCCLAEIALTAPFLSEISLNDTVAVFGLGTIGNLCAQLYKIAGCTVIGLDPVKSRGDLAKKVGISNIIDAAPDKQVEALLEATGGKGADITVDVVGHSGVVCNCIKGAKGYGQVVLLGTPRAPHEGDMTVPFQDIHMKCITVRGAHMWQMPAMELVEQKCTVPWAYKTVFDYMLDGRLQVEPLRSHVVKPEEASKIYDGLQNDRETYTSVVFDWS